MNSQKAKVLIVDDEENILFALKLLLEHHGFNAYTEQSGENCVETINKLMPDLIILDVLLGVIDGRDVCRLIKLDEKTAHIPIMMFSANLNFQTSMKQCLADDFIVKPFDMEFLINRINAVLALSSTYVSDN